MSSPHIIAELQKNKTERLRVALDRWQQHELVDIRVTTQLAAHVAEWVPTKKGVSLRLAMLPELIEALQAALKEAKARGLVEDLA